MTNHPDLSAEELREKIGLAIGAASMCWDPIPTGVFDSVQAQKVYESLHVEIVAMIDRRDQALEALRQAMHYVACGGAYDYLPEMNGFDSGKCYALDALAAADKILKGDV